MKFQVNLVKQQRNQGIILLTALILTVVMTALVLTITRSATLEERISFNAQNRQLALQSAEAIVRDAESSIFLNPPLEPFNPGEFVDGCQNGFCRGLNNVRWQTHDWNDPALVRGFDNEASNIDGVADQPVYFVEYVDYQGTLGLPVCPILVFRVVGRGLAADGAESLVETMFNFRPSAFADGSCGS
jgi:type IV pilus assembly protein PilX